MDSPRPDFATTPDDSAQPSPFPEVAAPDALSGDRMREIFDRTPRGFSLGRLAEIGVLAAQWQAQVPPRPISQARVIVFAGDHGISERGISSFARSASVEQAEEIQAGGGPVHILGRTAGAGVRLVDISLDREAWGDERVSRSCPPIDQADAMSTEDLSRALTIGQRVADQEIDAGADLLIPGDLGVGLTTVSAAVIGCITRTEPVAVVGPGSGVDDEMWKRKVTVLRDAMFRARHLRNSPLDVLRMISSPDFAALVGFIGQAAARRTPVLLDGAPVTAAAFVADLLAPGARAWFAAGQLSPEPAHLIALQKMDLIPLIALSMSTGQGTGALAALPLITGACELAADEAAAAAGAQVLAEDRAELETDSDV